MKKITLILSIAVLLVGCKKKDPEPQTPNEVKKSAPHEYMLDATLHAEYDSEPDTMQLDNYDTIIGEMIMFRFPEVPSINFIVDKSVTVGSYVDSFAANSPLKFCVEYYIGPNSTSKTAYCHSCLLYTSDAADDMQC